MKIVTRCTSVEQFVATYHRFCAPSSCFIPSADSREIGCDAAFSLRLADGTPLLRGLCVVLSSWSTPVNPFGRPGMHIALVRLTPDSRVLYDRLLATAAAALAAISSAPAPDDTVKVAAPVDAGGIPIAAPDDVTAPIPAGMAFATFDDEDEEGVPQEDELEPGTTRTETTTTLKERQHIATLLGMAPLARTRPTGNAVPIAIRGTPGADVPPPVASTPVRPGEVERPRAGPPRAPALARLAHAPRPSRRGMRPLLVTRAVSVIGRDERWWYAIALLLALGAVLALLASAYRSLH